MKSILFFALVVAAACAQDVATESTEAVVPESTSLVETMATAEEQALAEENARAHTEASDYLKKAGAGACKDLADATEKEVQDSVAAEQNILNKIDKGADCPDEGQDAIKAMEGKLKEAEDAKKKADKAYDDALNTDVNFGSRKFNTLTEGQCATFFNSAAYQNAKKKVADAKKTKDAAAGTVTQAKTSLQAAKDAAVVAVKKCQCNAYKAHSKALTDANAKVVSSQTKAWTKAAHLKCVLDGKTTNQCTVPALPKVKAVTMAAGVSFSKCSAWAGHPQCGNCVLTGANTDNHIGRLYKKDGDHVWNSGCYMKAQTDAPRKNQYLLEAKWQGHGTGRGGHVHAMWGFDDPKIVGNSQSYLWKHDYRTLDYAFYCHAINHALHIYESNGHSRGATSCNCGTWANSKLYMNADGAVHYQMQSSQHGLKACYASKVKATGGPYIVDESIYGKYCDLTNLKLTEKINGQFVAPH